MKSDSQDSCFTSFLPINLLDLVVIKQLFSMTYPEQQKKWILIFSVSFPVKKCFGLQWKEGLIVERSPFTMSSCLNTCSFSLIHSDGVSQSFLNRFLQNSLLFGKNSSEVMYTLLVYFCFWFLSVSGSYSLKATVWGWHQSLVSESITVIFPFLLLSFFRQHLSSCDGQFGVRGSI